MDTNVAITAMYLIEAAEEWGAEPEKTLAVVADVIQKQAVAPAVAELLSALQITTAFLALEAEGHALRGDEGKANACRGQVKDNRALITKYSPAE